MNKKKDKDSNDFDNFLTYFQSSNVTKIKEMQTKYLRVVEQEQFKSGAFSPAGLVRDNFAEICLVERPDDTIFERVAGEKMKDCFSHNRVIAVEQVYFIFLNCLIPMLQELYPTPPLVGWFSFC